MPSDPSPSPEVPEAIVKKALEVFRASRKTNDRANMRAALTAALRLNDPETVERVARALWDASWAVEPAYSWERVSNKDRFRDMARGAISALLNTTDDEEAGEHG